ncbi:MAG: DivIVA domain-containing protein [Ignavibacteriales bacterium]|nr:MAG: DivIVA domain-containing protein [Ignavibacteriales bacterium]
MKFSPLNIKNQEFNKSVRGYDKDEVHLFLEKLADEFEKLVTENDTVKKELEQAKNRIAEYKKIEKNLQDTLLKAHESSSRAVESAKKQSVLMIKEAELKANQLIDKARESADDIRNSVLGLREEKALLIAKLKALINSQASILEMKINETAEEKKPVDKPGEEAKLDINIDDILEKLL